MELDYGRLKEIKPALSGYIRESQALLKRSPVPDEDTIHDIRVLMKKSRAVLKLAAPQLEKESCTKDIVALREVGRKMCSWRESSVHRKTLKELKKEFPGIFSKLSDIVKINNILKKPDSLDGPPEIMKAGLEEISELLNKAGYRIRFQSMNKIDHRLLIKELEVTYTLVVYLYLTCRNNPKPDSIHELRKKSKDFLYQLFFFRPLNPSVVKALEKKLESITQNLGKFNDLTQLVKALDYKYPVNIYQPAIDELVIKIREKQDRYLAKVWPAAYKIFCPGQKLVNVLGFKLLII